MHSAYSATRQHADRTVRPREDSAEPVPARSLNPDEARDAQSAMPTTYSPDSTERSVSSRVVAAWILGLVALTTAGWVGRHLAVSLGFGPRVQEALPALVMSGVVVASIWWLRTHRDGLSLRGLGLQGGLRSAKYFAIGSGLILAPAILTVACTAAFGWATLSVNDAPGIASTSAMALATTLFYEALPEEILFRGYIYSTLNTTMRRWTAGLATSLLFVLVPIVSVQIQQQLMGMNVHIGNASQVTAGYVVTLFIFGSIQQYLRILTNSTWTCVGFHLVFVLSNRIVGIRDSVWIRLSDVVSEGPLQIVFIGSTLLITATLLLYPRATGRSLGLNTVSPE